MSMTQITIPSIKVGDRLTFLIFLVLVGGYLTALYYYGDETKIFKFFQESITFSAQLAMVIIMAFLAGLLMHFLRGIKKLDVYSAGSEMSVIRERHGTDGEKPGDNTSIGTQYGSSTIYYAVIIYAFFSMYSG